MNKNNKGFTLVELLGTIIILALVVSIAGFSITGILNSSKEKNYNLLIGNIKDAAELYYQECRFANNNKTVNGVKCNIVTINNEKYYQVSLGSLITYGYLSGNGKTSDKENVKLVNPKKTSDEISGCEINIKFDTNSKKVVVTPKDGSDEICPKKY